MIIIYSLTILLLTPFFIFRLLFKSQGVPSYRKRINERFGLYRASYAPVDVCVHAVSFGEVEASRPLIDLFLSAGRQVCVTTMTPSGSSRLKEIYKDKVSHVYLPYDLSCCLQRFLQTFRPKLFVIIETEIWPNLYRACHQAEIPLVVANARLSPRSFKSYMKARFFFKPILQQASAILAQTKADKRRFFALGAREKILYVSGNLKFDIKPSEEDCLKGESFKRSLGARPVFIAGSTHPGEESQVIEAFKLIKQREDKSILLLAIRHPERAAGVTALLREHGLSYERRSEVASCQSGTAVYLIDVLGELNSFYVSADVAFVGGSLVPHGGHNVLEPICVNVPVISGPHMFNFAFIKQRLVDEGGIQIVENSVELAAAALKLIDNKELREGQVSAANTVLKESQGAITRQFDVLHELLEGKS